MSVCQRSPVQPNPRNPSADQPRVLSRRYKSVPTATAAEEEIARLLDGGSYITVDRLTGLLSHLKPDGLAVFLWSMVARSTV